MAQYAIAFDLNQKEMTNQGLSKADITRVYQQEVRDALANCGFTEHPQGSLYTTKEEQNPITALMQLQTVLKTQAPNFCKFVKRVHVFRMEEWSDVTQLIAAHPAEENPSIEDELEDQMPAA